MPLVENSTNLLADVPYVNGERNFLHPQYQQVVTALGQYVVQNQIGMILSIPYSCHNGTLERVGQIKLASCVLAGDPNGQVLYCTSGTAGVRSDLLTTVEQLDFLANADQTYLPYDLLETVAVDFLESTDGTLCEPGHSWDLHLVTVGDKTYLGQDGSEEGILRLLRFVPLYELVHFLYTLQVSEEDLQFCGGNLVDLLFYYVPQPVLPESWAKGSKVSESDFDLTIRVTSGYSPLLVKTALQLLDGTLQEVPGSIQEQLWSALRKYTAYLQSVVSR